MLQAIRNLPAEKRGRLLFGLVVLAYFGSSLLQYRAEHPEQMTGFPHISLGYLYIAPPMVLSGDSPHYLVELNSIIEDGDLDVSNNSRPAFAGDWDAGARFRGSRLLHHVDLAPDGRQYSIHPPYLLYALAPLVYAFRNGPWVEPVSIWIVMAVTLLGLWFFAVKTGNEARWAALLALGTPLWCYSRDLWTEPWTTVAWIGLMFTNSLIVTGLLAFCGVLLRYPFFVAVAAMAMVALWRREMRRAIVLGAAGGIATGVGIALAQYEFRDVGHFALFHMGWHATGAGQVSPLLRMVFPVRGLVGLLLDPRDGLLPFVPFVIWGFTRFRDPKYLPALFYYMLHSLSMGWHGGTGFSARYLVPLLPLLVLAVSEKRPHGPLFMIAVGWSLFWGFVGGILPAIAYDRSAWEMVRHVWTHLLGN